MAQAVALPRQCDEVGCSEVMTTKSDRDAWQVIPGFDLVLCDAHRRCEECYGKDWLVDGRVCDLCFDPYPEL